MPTIGQGQAPGMWAIAGGASLRGAGIASTHRPGERPHVAPSGRETVGGWRADGWGVAEAPCWGPWGGHPWGPVAVRSSSLCYHALRSMVSVNVSL